MTNLYNTSGNIDVNQNIYDSFNSFIFSSDRNVFNKLIIKHAFYKMTEHLHGDIVECGVFKGSGLLAWLKLLDMYEPNSLKKVLGFDFFNPKFVDQLTDDVDKATMQQVFDRDSNLIFDDVSKEGIEQKIKSAGFNGDKCVLIPGDISLSSMNYIKDRPGLRISILYLDMDLEKPTYDALNILWDRVVRGGVVVFDEYAYHSWSESNAVDRFICERNLKLCNTNIKAPTAYIVKP
jgi:hypothetical protein